MTTRFPYHDPALAIDQRVEDLLARMSVEDKAGLLFQPLAMMDLDSPGFLNSPSTRVMLDRRINHFNILQAPTALEIAEWTNAMQAEAQQHPLGIPITFSSDPRHSFDDNPGAILPAGPFSQWPETLGFAALDDTDLVRRFADIVRREYLAVGIRVALHPQIDLATEPRWARTNGTFGESVELVSRLGAAYIEGLQGAAIGAESVAAMAKHFPGGGPQKDGEDPHFPYGREQIYPGGAFDTHLEPFRAAIAANVSQLMPYYGMPVGTEYEEVGFGFNRGVITGLLREQLGFDGIVCSDWGILSGMCWGVEELSFEERMIKALDAGIDQFGGEFDTETLVRIVRSGRIDQARIDVSVRRLLREKFRLGLFEAPFVDAARADALVGTTEARAAGLEAQASSHTLLTNAEGPAQLPLTTGVRVYLDGIAPDVFATRADVVASPEQAEVAVVRVVAPWEKRTGGPAYEAFFHAGSLAFPEAEIERIRAIVKVVPVVLTVYLDRPAILTDLADIATTIMVEYGSSAEATARVLFGEVAARGRLPFDLPRSMAAVEQNRSDVPFDTADPLFRFGHGLGCDGGR